MTMRELTQEEIAAVAGGFAPQLAPAPGTVPWFNVGWNPENGQYLPPSPTLPPA